LEEEGSGGGAKNVAVQEMNYIYISLLKAHVVWMEMLPSDGGTCTTATCRRQANQTSGIFGI